MHMLCKRAAGLHRGNSVDGINSVCSQAVLTGLPHAWAAIMPAAAAAAAAGRAVLVKLPAGGPADHWTPACCQLKRQVRPTGAEGRREHCSLMLCCAQALCTLMTSTASAAYCAGGVRRDRF
jgi:hypothetical protein